MIYFEPREPNLVAADLHPTCWFCQRGKAIDAHHHYGDGCKLADASEKAS